MKVCLITCFYGRAEKVERILRFFLDQTYKDSLHLLLFNNSPVEQTLGDISLPSNKTIALVNNFKDLQTGKEYTNTGDIFRDALTFVPQNTDVISFFDSDDCFLPLHVEKGVEGISALRYRSDGLFSAYKPYSSWFIYGDKLTLENNNLEPSIFIKYEFVKKYGFNKTSSSYHDGWLTELRKQNALFEDKNGLPTLIYNWESGHNTYKISGSGDDGPENLKKHRQYETDFGDGFLNPSPKEVAEKYYKLIHNYDLIF